MQWWSLAKKDEPLGIPIENEDFVKKFKSTFVDKIAEVQKKLKIKDPVIIVGKDCPRKNIWRYDLMDSYKESRDKDDGFLGGPFFKLAYDSLFQESGVHSIVGYPRLEADDCIALTVERIKESVADANIWVITSDMDYLQLSDENVHLYNLKYQDLTQSKNATGNPECDKFCKIVCGDKSDDIPGVFAKCGIKTALKLYNDPETFKQKLEKETGAKERFERNTRLVDFNMIPTELRLAFRSDVLKC
jgi:5'-3' exonuclease